MLNLLKGISSLPPGETISHPDLFNESGQLQPMAADWWNEKSREERMRFGHHNALYGFITNEGAEWLKSKFDPASTLEIGSGNGHIAAALGIRATDNFQQVMPKYRSLYEATQQPIINYGRNVENISASDAIRKYKPKTVIASWVTHKYIPLRHELGGNEIGVDEHSLLNRVDNYIFIGNSVIHLEKKPIFLDLQSGRLASHEVADFKVDSRIFPSRASQGFDFCIHLRRKGMIEGAQ